MMLLSKRKTSLNLRDHVGAEFVALSIVIVASTLFAAWSASRAAQIELDARTKARLLPPGQRNAPNLEGQ